MMMMTMMKSVYRKGGLCLFFVFCKLSFISQSQVGLERPTTFLGGVM